MNLAKALKEKNKKAKNILKKIQKLSSNNVYEEGTVPTYHSLNLYDEVKADINDFIVFKTKLFNATAPIRSKIFELGELKSFLAHLNNLSTGGNSGLGGYRRRVIGESTEPTKWKATIDELKKDELVVEIEKRIEVLQDEIDIFNATTNLNGENSSNL